MTAIILILIVIALIGAGGNGFNGVTVAQKDPPKKVKAVDWSNRKSIKRKT